jgi:hypothetical protein
MTGVWTWTHFSLLLSTEMLKADATSFTGSSRLSRVFAENSVRLS